MIEDKFNVGDVCHYTTNSWSNESQKVTFIIINRKPGKYNGMCNTLYTGFILTSTWCDEGDSFIFNSQEKFSDKTEILTKWDLSKKSK